MDILELPISVCLSSIWNLVRKLRVSVEHLSTWHQRSSLIKVTGVQLIGGVLELFSMRCFVEDLLTSAGRDSRWWRTSSGSRCQWNPTSAARPRASWRASSSATPPSDSAAARSEVVLTNSEITRSSPKLTGRTYAPESTKPFTSPRCRAPRTLRASTRCSPKKVWRRPTSTPTCWAPTRRSRLISTNSLTKRILNWSDQINLP